MTISDQRACCQKCNYSLVGLASEGGKCTECGTPYDAALLARTIWRAKRRGVLARVASNFRVVAFLQILSFVALEAVVGTDALPNRAYFLYGPAYCFSALGNAVIPVVYIVLVGFVIEWVIYYYAIKWFYRVKRSWRHLLWMIASIALIHFLCGVIA